MNFEKVNERTVNDGPGAANWAAAGDSWVAEDSATIGGKGTQLEITDFYYSVGTGEDGDNRVFASLAVPSNATKASPLIIVFHGGGGHGDSFLAVSVARNNPGFAVLAMDYNGQFRPSKNPITQWTTVDDSSQWRAESSPQNAM